MQPLEIKPLVVFPRSPQLGSCLAFMTPQSSLGPGGAPPSHIIGPPAGATGQVRSVVGSLPLLDQRPPHKCPNPDEAGQQADGPLATLGFVEEDEEQQGDLRRRVPNNLHEPN